MDHASGTVPPRRPRRETLQNLLVGREHLQTWMTLLIALVLLVAQWTDLLPTPWLGALGLTPPGWWHLIPLAVIAVAMLVKRTRPLTALLIGGACVTADLAIGGSAGIWFCLMDLIYYLGLRGDRHILAWLTGVFTAVVVTAAAALLLLEADLRNVISVVLLLGSVLLLPLWWSVEVRRGYPLGPMDVERDRLDAERHAVLVRLHELDRRRAVTAERQRMARELHDVISSHVSAIALHSGAALTAAPDSPRDRRTLEEVRRTSVTALEDLRAMVSLLRGQEGAADDGAAPWGERGGAGGPAEELLVPPSVEEVLASAARHGLSLEVSGHAPRAGAESGEATGRSVCGVVARVLQEALTNAATHGDGTARVDFSRSATHLRLQVINGLRRADQDPDRGPGQGPTQGLGGRRPPSSTTLCALATGTGLISMQERVVQAGGTLHSARDGDQWVLTAELPHVEGGDDGQR
ncbi:sensor histidine kinase [Nesterenkonia xinjiangensis]|uniref:histidine kinase n=1 Tax=Nesterenkonia xinjiangensis TaxID=225327 RepID=A0A7Z0GLQ2_9MICC|nr:histidine kinase [Nesterenkonia xinjiangensis]NYJ78311.1 signal transduction histidine kinase [Nesterenkonia xinjiangensis]